MASPNVKSLTTVLVDTAHLDATATPADLIAAVASGHARKVEAIYATNVHASTIGTISVWHRVGSTDHPIALEERIPLRSKVNVLIGGPLYLDEGDSIKVQANQSANVHVSAPYVDMT